MSTANSPQEQMLCHRTDVMLQSRRIRSMLSKANKSKRLRCYVKRNANEVPMCVTQRTGWV